MGKKYQVVIVGGGPVGVGLALELGQRGISCALIERRTGMHNIPKGQNLTGRSVEHFHFWGVADAMRAARPLPPGYPTGGVTAYKTLTSQYWYANEGRDAVRAYYFQPNDRIPQYRLETVMRARMAELPNVDSLFGWTVRDISQDDAGVRVVLRDAESGEEQTVEGEYAVGCDGSHSTVREAAGIKRSGANHDQLMVLAVFRSREFNEGLKRFPERSTFRVMNPDLKGYWQFFGRVDPDESFFFHAPVPNDTTRDNYDFHQLLQSIAGFEFSCTFDYVGFWDMLIAVADEYQAGRIFIAGDAAHSHPPYGGYGLNNGLEDSRNLGWKLAARLQGWGGDDLLASYSIERRPVFQETARDFIAGRIETDAAFFERYDPERDRAAFEAAWGGMAAGVSGMVLGYAPNYEGSPVIAGPPGGVCTAHGAHQVKARAGHHLTPQPLSSGLNVYEELGSGFTLLAFGVEDGARRAFEEAAARASVPLKVVSDSYEGGREGYETRLVLVRPDQYIVWTGDSAPADPEALLRQSAGRA